MRTLLLSLFYTISISACFGFAGTTDLETQVAKSDTILRIVVLSTTTIEDGSSFKAIAKCRIVTKIKGGHSLGDFIFIPCAYNVDPDRSPIDLEGDFIVMLNTLEGVDIGHPVTYDSVYPIEDGKITYFPELEEVRMTPEAFQKLIQDQPNITKKENKSEMATPRKPSD